MALALRRFGKRGYTRVDLIQSGPQAGAVVIFESAETDRIAVITDSPSGTAAVYEPGDAAYDFWDNNINASGDFEMGSELSVEQTKLSVLILWLEFWLWPQLLQVDTVMVNAGWTNTQRVRGFGASLASWGVPLSQAQSIASAWVNSATKPAYGDLGLSEPPAWVLDMAGVFAYPGADIKT